MKGTKKMLVATMAVLFWQSQTLLIFDLRRIDGTGNDGSDELIYNFGRLATRSAIERRMGRVL